MIARRAAAAFAALLRCTTCLEEALADGEDGLACGNCGDTFPVRNGVAHFQRTFDAYSANYDRICADDLEEPKTPDVVKRIFAELVVERTRGTVCDLGCGDGYVIRRIDAPTRVAVDIALPYLERLPPPILPVWSRIEGSPLRTSCADTIVCTDVLEHVLDAEALVAEIERVLKPDGTLLIAFPFEQDLAVYDLSDYKAKYAEYEFVHLRSISDDTIAELFPRFETRFTRLITEGMALMEFKPFPIKFVELARGTV